MDISHGKGGGTGRDPHFLPCIFCWTSFLLPSFEQCIPGNNFFQSSLLILREYFQIPGQEDLILRMGQEGHQVGVHTYNHVLLTGLDPAEVEAELSPCRDLLEELLGPGEYLLRPPYGLTNQALLSQVRAPVVLWSVDPEDWDDRDTAREVKHILEHARDGSIILLHDIFPESVDAALQVVDALQAQGYRFVTVSQLFQARGITLEMGRVYGSAYPQT